MSVTSAINGQLGAVCTFCTVLLLGAMMHKVTNIISRLLLAGLIFLPSGGDKLEDPLHKYAQKGLVGAALHFVIMIVVTCGQLCVVILNIGWTLLYGLLPLVGLALVLVLMHERWNDSMLVMVDMFNGEMGEMLRAMLLSPLVIIDALGTYVLPVYNLIVFVVIRTPTQVLLWLLKGPGLVHLMDALGSIREAAGGLALSSKRFALRNNPAGCAMTSSVCNNMTGECVNLNGIQLASLCFQDRELDFMPAFEKIQESSHHINLFVGESCAFIAVFAKILIYPLSDTELWLGLDRLLNAVLYAFVSAPSMTITRCKLAGGIEKRPAMCTPDFGPAFTKVAEFGVHAGNVISNWMDAAYLFLFYQTNLDTVCDDTTITKKLNEILWTDPVVQRMFGKNQTIMTRLSDEAFAVSDGSGVVFLKNTAGQIRKTYSPNLWPVPIDPRSGIARVFLPGGVNVQDNGLGLMGCRCVTDGGEVRVECTTITQDGTVWEMPVRWSLAAEVQLLTCDRLRIVVQSIRWPHNRVVSNVQNINGEVPTADCVGCLVADAVVYAIPVCGAADGFKAMACFPEKSFTRGICFPYCMALRLKHEGFQALAMRGALEWSEGVLLAMRSCVPTTMAATTEGAVQTTCNLGDGTQSVTTYNENNNNKECTYAYSCSTLVLNKTTGGGSETYNYHGGEWPAAPKASWDGSHLLLMGQPLAIGGDVFMRMFKPTNSEQKYVDFPTVVGNQLGEFSVEANIPVGIPVTTRANVEKNAIKSEKVGEIYEPVQYVSPLVPYNPGTLTATALWYASNPSYDWIKSMAVYCASEGHNVTTQFMILSSYAPTRLWRVLYHEYERCYIAKETGIHVCAPDVAVATSIEKSIQVMTSDGLDGSTTLYDMCQSGEEFNLWVESLEYYDEENIAVGVRRGTLGDLGQMLSSSPSVRGRTVFYFFNASNITQPPSSGNPLRQKHTTCPAFKVMPDAGAVLGHAIATVAHMLRMPVNMVLNPFAMVELLFSRAHKTCPENSLQHSVLDNCGMKLLSLDDFFTELYNTNDAAWNIGAWLLATLLPQQEGGNSAEATMFRSFIQGALVVGDATKVVGMFDVVHSVEVFDTGVQESMLGGRRLLGVKVQMLGKMLNGLKSGMGSLLNLGQSVAGLATMSLSSANFGMLLASQDPTTQFAGAAVGAPTIAWAQFTYQTSVPIVLDVLGTLKQTGSFSMTPVWGHLQDARDKFENIVQGRSRRACMGLRIMLGYSGSLGKALYYNCLAAQEMVGGMMTLVLAVLVDVSVYRCLCVNPVGSDYYEYVQAQCIPMIPPTRQNWWQRTMDSVTSQSGENMISVCKNYSDTIDAEIYGAFDGWKIQAIRSAESIASVMDEFFVPEAHAGSCQNTLTNPTAMVLTPTPLAHYEVCARTSSCKARCAEPNGIFQYELQRLQNEGSSVHKPPSEYDVSVESPLVNRYGLAVADRTQNIVAMRTLPANASVYGCQTRCVKGACIALAIANEPITRVWVEYYCLPPPEMILASVYKTNLDAFEIDVSELGGDIRGVDFALQNENVYVVIYVYKSESTVALGGDVSLLQSHQVYVHAKGGTLTRILRSEDLADQALGQANVVAGLFGSGVIPQKMSAFNCRVKSITEVASGQSGVLVFFVDFSISVQGWIADESADGSSLVENSYSVYAILRWSETTTITVPVFYPPCGCLVGDCGGLCNPKLQTMVEMARYGVFMHTANETYLYLQTVDDDGAGLWMRRVQINPIRGLESVDSKTRLTGSADNTQIIGRWTRGSMFAAVETSRGVRDSATHAGTKNSVFPFFFQADPQFSSRWLQEIRLVGTGKLKAFSSQKTTQVAMVRTTCTALSCSGCATSKLRLLCHQAQNCALSKCLGTIVQTKNALCGMGNMLEQTFIQAVTTWHAMFMVGAELGMLIAKGLAGQSIRVIVLKFPTEQFYNLLCACKDMLAGVVGLCMSVGQVLSNLLGGQGLDLTGGQDVGALVGEQSLKTMSIGQFFFNCITGVSLLPLMAVHRWLMCMANTSLVATSEIGVSVQFGDVYMDTTWMQCAHVTSAFDILNNNNMGTEIESVVIMFVRFVITLVTGIGESLLFLLELGWDSTVDFLIGVVFGIQDILYTFNMRSCKVPNYAMRYVLWCSCQDEEYRIPATQRGQGMRDGALWCVGSLSMTLLDGSVGIVYNPYTMDQLSEGVRGVTDYIGCLSQNSDPSLCNAPSGEATMLSSLVAQSVEPIAVWARCKTNYMHSTWDIGAGALFSTTEGNNNNNNALQSIGVAWGQALGEEFMQCMRDSSRILVDYSTCMRLFFSISQNATPANYFLYEKKQTTEPPDACLVFSGLNASAPVNSTLQTQMNNCLMQEGVGQVTECDLNPLIWSGNHPHKMPAANLHGTVFSASKNSSQSELYQIVVKTFQQAVAAFEKVYDQQSTAIDSILFSADGDFIHDFFDCMYLGPYTRIDMLPCDSGEDNLDCLFYARDNASGASRTFTACFGEEMHGDHRLPFTCGSQARRSLIKYFFRNYTKELTGGSQLNMNISKKIKDVTEALIRNYSNANSWGCWDPVNRSCRLDACNYNNGYAPCLSSNYEITSEQVSDFIVSVVLGSLKGYYEMTMQHALPWTAYYTDMKTPGPPAQWGKDASSAALAQHLGLFAPHTPLVTYGPEEVYSVPTPESSTAQELIHGSPTWGVCTGLLAQTAMSLPMVFSEKQQQWFPAGFVQSIPSEGSGNMNNLDEIEWVVGNITRSAMMMDHCPFAWHQNKRHAPSQSAVCARTKQQWGDGKAKLKVGSVSINTAKNTIRAQVEDGLTFPFYGFMQGHLGYADQTCVCAASDTVEKGKCVMSDESCRSFLAANGNSMKGCEVVRSACSISAGRYPRASVEAVWECLKEVGAGVRCPELGPSDRWGLFPVDCGETECDMAQQWATEGANNINYDATRFLNEGRAGMRLPNFRHVNNTFHRTIHYGQSGKNPTKMAQTACFDKEGDSLFPTSPDEDVTDDSVIRRLFPAAQVLFDSPSTATCTRYVIEVVRAEAMGLVSDDAGATARIQVARWKRRCAAKMRQLSLCKMNGVFYDVAPPKTQVECGGITLTGVRGAYMTPGCVVVDQQQRRMYDAHMCLSRDKNVENSVINDRLQLTDACALKPQPLDLVEGSFPLSMVYTTGKKSLASPDALTELSNTMTLDRVLYVQRDEKSSRDHISHVVDWWPTDENVLAMPVGYHPTAAMDPTELAPALFDSHFMFDAATQKAFYVHSGVRNGSLLYTTVGAGGLCRSPSVGMPLFDANTNRVCTRMAKTAGGDTPTIPITEPITAGGMEETGPTFSDAYVAKHFEANEFCGNSHSDVPWTADPDDFQSQSAGGILGWQHHVTMDARGVTSYDLGQVSFPPDWYELSELPKYEGDKWGDACGNITWGSGKTCSNNDCPVEGMVCLPIPQQEGLCYGKSSMMETARRPCFRTDHCADGMVCLADGGCAPMYVHVWNDKENHFDMEATILADKCGFFEKVHPYTQSMRGATPWEMVPDMMHVHGMCSHHNWFSYRHAIEAGVCARRDNEAFLRCNTSVTEWPWVIERFDNKAANGRQTMAGGNMLLTRAHPCDARFMHLQTAEGNRMEVCSGFEGQEADPLSMTSTYMHYDLNAADGTWKDVVVQNSEQASTAQWLRTYDESTSEVHVGIAEVSENTDVPLGFLGADQSAEGVPGEMSVASNVKFFRCTDRLQCNNPPYTYNGVEVSQRLVAQQGSLKNMTELSLRMCGAIGHLKDATICTLDLPLFPLFSVLSRGGCSLLWPNFLTVNSQWVTVSSTPSATASNLASNPQMLFCAQEECIYAARLSSQLSQQNTGDSITFLTNKLNDILQKAAKAVVQAVGTATTVYEAINQCMAATLTATQSSQAALQVAYGTAGASGAYLGYSLTLYEIPLGWLHHAMLVALLSTIDGSVRLPALEQMGSYNTIQVDLWGAEREMVCANLEPMSERPFLWKVLCAKNQHPSYTFDAGSSAQRDAIATIIRDAAAEAVVNTMMAENGQTSIFCYEKASWNCDPVRSDYAECREQLIMAYNETSCLEGVMAKESPWLRVCANSRLFRLENLKKYSLQGLTQGLPMAGQQQMASFLKQGQTALLENLQTIAQAVDYVTQEKDIPELVKLTVVDAAQFVREAMGTFDFEKWLENDVCDSAFSEEMVCKTQEYARLNPPSECLFQNVRDRRDMDRYLIEGEGSAFYNPQTKKTQPEVILSYGTDAYGYTKEPTRVRFCDKASRDQCMVQHFDNVLLLQTGGQDDVLCDIERVQAPPGVELQLFAITGVKYASWKNLIEKLYSQQEGAPDKWCSISASKWGQPLSPVKNCVWHQTDAGDNPEIGSGWLSGPSDFEPIDQTFSDLDGEWDNKARSQWRSAAGCHASDILTGFCAVRMRLANTPGATRGVCDDSEVFPDCAEIMKDNSMSTFRMFTDTAKDHKGFYQCKPCTKYSKVIHKEKGRFQCFASSDEGKTKQSQITVDSIARTLRFLADPQGLTRLLTEQDVFVDERVALIPKGYSNPLALTQWGGNTACEQYGCWHGFESTATSEANQVIWNHAINNPTVRFTMICGDQPYSNSDRTSCNPRLDKRRQALATFVEQQYRKKNGVWMPQVKAGKGIGWRANVAHSSVGMFSVMYAKSNRGEEEKALAWVLGSNICGSSQTIMQDRICVESTQAASSAFEAVHPWVGGNYNPFEEADECLSSLCPCECSPQRVCDYYANQTTKMNREFVARDTCQGQAFPRWRTMKSDDSANLCGAITNMVTQKLSMTTCMHSQGLFGGALGNGNGKISTEEMHGAGIFTADYEFLTQGLLDKKNGLWGGKTMGQEAVNKLQKYAFLRMARSQLHPAHIAFGRDLTSNGGPLVMKALALLPHDNGFDGTISSSQWVQTLHTNRAKEAEWILTLYPQLGVSSQQRQQHDWSCPLRAVAFWGGTGEAFSPITPDPIVTHRMFGESTHPFIVAESLRRVLGKYETSNGACFYEKGKSRALIRLEDGDNQCGLQGMVRNLHGSTAVLSRVLNQFNSRCNTVLMDAPNASLRSGERLPVGDAEPCGVLHRLTPFLMRTKGDGGNVTRITGLSTSSEGGDCHMGRAFAYSYENRRNVVGRQCALSSKNRTHGISLCPREGSMTSDKDADYTTMELVRVQPPSLKTLLLPKRKRLYRSSTTTPIQFVGPGGVPLTGAEESSFGLLYSASIMMTMATDLKQTCRDTPGCAEVEAVGGFWQKYVTRGGLVNSNQKSTQRGQNVDPSVVDATARRAKYVEGVEKNTALWTKENWAWTFQKDGTVGGSRGTVDSDHWLRDRYGACNASYNKYGRLPKGESLVEAITLCEPAPTGGLQTFCQAMSKFRTDMANINCQIVSQGKVCLYRPGMFYLPYQWSGTNQEFIADTVLEYYSDILKQPRFAASPIMSTLCPARNAVMGNLYEQSLKQRDLCPGYQIEYLKDVLKTFKTAGHDLLYLGFCAVMAGANLVGTVFAVDPAAIVVMLRMAVHYVIEMVRTAALVIMPILNTIIDVMFGTSDAGRVIKNIFEVLCETFNFVVEKIIIPIWCGMIRPWWGGILRGLQKLIRVFDSGSADKMEGFLSTVFGSNSFDVKECLGSIKAHIPCGSEKEGVDDSLFPNQPMATRCWVDTSHTYYTAGASVLMGSATNSFLACTVSDTCAVDPLRFDNYENAGDLVPCIMCPSVSLTDQGQKFGCNTYLKRCTCGVRTQAPAACTRNSDCSQQPTSICSVASNLDFARDSTTSMICSECGSLGAEPVCVMDGAESTGVCTCSVVRRSLQTCQVLGQSVFLLDKVGQCLCMSAMDQINALSLSFGELNVAQCMRGVGSRCLLVSLPLTSGGAQAVPFAVLTGVDTGLFKPQQLLFTGGGRRLLGEEPHRRWCESNWGGEDVRWCTYWKMIGNNSLATMGMNDAQNNNISDAFLLSMGHLARFCMDNPRLVAQMMQEHPQLIQSIMRHHDGLWPHVLLMLWQGTEDLLGMMQPAARNPTNYSSNNNARRKLMLWETETTVVVEANDYVKLPSCAAVEIPLNQIIDAFWDTVTYYDDIPRSIAGICGHDNSTECEGYKLPPIVDDSPKYPTGATSTMLEAFMYIPTGGIGARQVLNAMLSTMPYDEAVAHNYVTGRRVIKEISSCNYTTLTFGAPMLGSAQLIPSIITVSFFFLLFTLFFSPHAMITWALWVFVFPSILYWLIYNLSPLCWPMVPPRFPHDLTVAIKSIVPGSFEIPGFLVKENCTIRGRRVEDDVYDPDACFKSCAGEPFLLLSWQDELAWWLCEIDTGLCRNAATMVTGKWGALQDMTASLSYYADVMDFSEQDSDFMHAHRVCAIFGMYHLIFAVIVAIFAVLMAPAVIMSILQVFSLALELIVAASGADNA